MSTPDKELEQTIEYIKECMEDTDGIYICVQRESVLEVLSALTAEREAHERERVNHAKTREELAISSLAVDLTDPYCKAHQKDAEDSRKRVTALTEALEELWFQVGAIEGDPVEYQTRKKVIAALHPEPARKEKTP